MVRSIATSKTIVYGVGHVKKQLTHWDGLSSNMHCSPISNRANIRLISSFIISGTTRYKSEFEIKSYFIQKFLNKNEDFCYATNFQ